MPHTPEKNPGGEWIDRKDIHPTTNIAGRAYKTVSGKVGVFEIGNAFPEEPIEFWYFAPTQEGQTHEERE